MAEFGIPGPQIERKKQILVSLDKRTTPAWNAPDGVLESTQKVEGRVAPAEISGLSRFISAPKLQQDLIEAMANGGIEVPEGIHEPVSNEQLDSLAQEVAELFEERLASERMRAEAGAEINGYHNESHNREVAERLLDILGAMNNRPPYEVARIMVLEIAPTHDSSRAEDGSEAPHIGMAVRKEIDGKSNEQISHELIDERLDAQGVPLYYRVMASGMVLATANFWDRETISPTTLYESVVIMADLAGYREHYAAWADQSIGVLKERISEMNRDIAIYETAVAEGKTIDPKVITELTALLPADTLEAFFGWQGGFVKYLKMVNKSFGDKYIAGGEEAWKWTPILQEKEAIVGELQAAAAESTQRGTDIREIYTQTQTADTTAVQAVSMIVDELGSITPQVEQLRARLGALAA